MPTLRKLLRLSPRYTKKSSSRKHAYANKTQGNKKPKYVYDAFASSELEGGIVPYIPTPTPTPTPKPTNTQAHKQRSFFTGLFAKKNKKPMTGGVAYTFNLDCKDGGLMRPEAISECPSRGPADPRFFTELY